MNKRIFFCGIIMFVIGLAMALISSFAILGINDFAFYTMFVFGCIIALIGLIMAMAGFCDGKY